MWIRSQDRTELIDIKGKRIYVSKSYNRIMDDIQTDIEILLQKYSAEKVLQALVNFLGYGVIQDILDRIGKYTGI